MRIPLVRFGSDDRPIAWWEWLFVPVVTPVGLTVLGILALLSIPYFTLYPDRHATDYDFGTPRQRAVMGRYRRLTARVSLRRRLGRVLAYPFSRRPRPRRAVRVVAFDATDGGPG